MQLRDAQHARRGNVRDQHTGGLQVGGPVLGVGQARRCRHHEHAAAVPVAEFDGGRVHGLQLGCIGRRAGNHNGLDGYAFTLGVGQRVLPAAIRRNRRRHGRPAAAAVGPCGGDLLLEVGIGDSQLHVQVGLGVQGDQLADVLRRGADEQEIALDLSHRTLAQVEVIDADSA